jgi:hypothetical protein
MFIESKSNVYKDMIIGVHQRPGEYFLWLFSFTYDLLAGLRFTCMFF